MNNQWDRWRRALAGEKLDLGERGNPPSGYFRRSCGDGRWEAICVYRDGANTLQCIRNIFGDGSKMSAGEIDEMFAGDVYPVPYEVYVKVAEEGEPWPAIYTTRLATSEIKRGIVWTEELGRKKIEAQQMLAENERAVIGDNSGDAAAHELLDARIADLLADRDRWLKSIGGKIATQEHADKAADFAKAFDTLENEAVESHKKEKEPHLKAGREVDARWKPVATKAEDGKRSSKALVTPFLRQQEEERREAARKATEEAQKQEASAPAPVEPVKARAGHIGRGVSLRTVKSTVITDLPALATYLAAMSNPPPGFVDECRKAADKVLRAGAAVPGAELQERQEAA